jgi:hypothetical protein
METPNRGWQLAEVPVARRVRSVGSTLAAMSVVSPRNRPIGDRCAAALASAQAGRRLPVGRHAGRVARLARAIAGPSRRPVASAGGGAA